MIVPQDLRKRLGKVKISETLPKDRSAAVRRAMHLTEQHKALFAVLRDPQSGSSTTDAEQILRAYDIPTRQLTQAELNHLPVQLENRFDAYPEIDEMPIALRTAFNIITGKNSKSLSVAMQFYEETVKTTPAVMQATKRYVKEFIDIAGDIELNELKRDHVRLFANELGKRLKPNSVKLAVVRLGVVVNYYSVEKDLPSITNPFRAFKIDTARTSDSDENRRPYTQSEFVSVLNVQHRKDPQLTLALHLIAVTGARASEIVGARIEDVKIDPLGQVHINIFDNAERQLKTKHSRRSVPIVLGAVQTLLVAAVRDCLPTEPLFPAWHNRVALFSKSCRRLVDAKVPMDPAATGNRVALHSLRHTITQALKDVQAPTDVINSILGWSGSGMASHYGSELALDVKREWMSKALRRLLAEDGSLGRLLA